MDTDSAYMALSAPLEKIIKPEMKNKFYQEYSLWFPRPFCHSHMSDFIRTKLKDSDEWIPQKCCRKMEQYDKRAPGLFKEEFQGEGIVALNSKTYFCWGKQGNKLSSKGVNKQTNKLTKEGYLDVLKKSRSTKVINKGFRLIENSIYTYNQVKTGLTYFYAKRRVEDDGVSTSNIVA